MNTYSTLVKFAEEIVVDSDGKIVTHSWIWPEKAELIYGTISSLIIFYALYRFALPAAMKAMQARTERIQKELDDAADARTSAEAEAAEIRRAKGDIGAERARLLADADAEAQRILADGRDRIDVEMAELTSRAEAEIAQLASRSGDELRAQISGLSSRATESLVAEHLDDAAHQRLIESFIAKVGAA